MYEYVFFHGAGNRMKPLVVVAFVCFCLCASTWLAICICLYPSIHCIMCAPVSVPVGNTCTALLVAGPGNTELQQPRLSWPAGLGTPQQNPVEEQM